MARKRLPKRVRHLVKTRAGGLCEYCRCRADCSCETFESEHIMPFFLGGGDDLENLALTCRGCNSRKSIRTSAVDPFSGQVFPLYNPRKDDWNEHFTWDADFLLMIGLTPIGRATVSTLKLNRLGVVNLRMLMKLGGCHPPLTD